MMKQRYLLSPKETEKYLEVQLGECEKAIATLRAVKKLAREYSDLSLYVTELCFHDKKTCYCSGLVNSQVTDCIISTPPASVATGQIEVWLYAEIDSDGEKIRIFALPGPFIVGFWNDAQISGAGDMERRYRFIDWQVKMRKFDIPENVIQQIQEALRQLSKTR